MLLTLRSRPGASRRAIAAGVGIQGATPTHHLDATESAGLLTRGRDPANFRVRVVELAERGEEAFDRMRGAAGAVDRQLHTGPDAAGATLLAELLTRVRADVDGLTTPPEQPRPDGAGLTSPSAGTAGTGPRR